MAWLAENIIGPFSGIVYGRKGDVVSVEPWSDDMALVSSVTEKFHVHHRKLSDKPVEPGPVEIVQLETQARPTRRIKKGIIQNPAKGLF